MANNGYYQVIYYSGQLELNPASVEHMPQSYPRGGERGPGVFILQNKNCQALVKGYSQVT